MDPGQTITIRFEDISKAEANQRVAELREHLLDLTPDVKAEVIKEDETTQDFGATLVLVLGAPAVVVIAKGIADYLRKHNSTIEIEEDGSIKAKNISGQDIAKIQEALSKKKN